MAKKYQKNLELYKEYIRNDYNYIDYYKNRIKEIIKATPYYGWEYKIKFNNIKDFEIYFFKDKFRNKVLVSGDVFEHYNIFTDEYIQLSDNIRKSYRRSLSEALMGLENEYVKEIQYVYNDYICRIDNFLMNIDDEIRR